MSRVSGQLVRSSHSSSVSSSSLFLSSLLALLLSSSFSFSSSSLSLVDRYRYCRHHHRPIPYNSRLCLRHQKATDSLTYPQITRNPFWECRQRCLTGFLNAIGPRSFGSWQLSCVNCAYVWAERSYRTCTCTCTCNTRSDRMPTNNTRIFVFSTTFPVLVL